MKDIRLELTGTTPLLCHSVALVDPLSPLVKEMGKYTAKHSKSKTDEDHRIIADLEWSGGLYIEDGQVVMPTRNLRKMLIDSGRISRKGTQVERAVSFMEMSVPIAYEGPTDMKALANDPSFRDMAAVALGTGKSKSRVMRCRPKFPHWAIVATLSLLDDVLNLSDLTMIAERAGVAVGLGDNRVNGYGRFKAVVSGR